MEKRGRRRTAYCSLEHPVNTKFYMSHTLCCIYCFHFSTIVIKYEYSITNWQCFCLVQYDPAILHTSFARLLGHPKLPGSVLS